MNKRKAIILAIAAAGTVLIMAETAVLLNYKSMYESVNSQLTGRRGTETSLSVSANEMFDTAHKVEQIIEEYYLYDIDTKAMKDGLLTGMLWGLGDPYSAYYDAQDYESLTIQATGEYSGVGAVISEMEDGTVSVVKVYPKSPSAEAGLQPEDVFYEIDEKNVVGEDSATIAAKLKGEAGTVVKVKVYRPSLEEYVSFSLTRRHIEIPSVSWGLAEDQIGVMKIESWDLATVNQFKNAMADLKSQDMKGLIIDVRNNPGGLVSSAASILDYFVPDGGKLVYTVDKNDRMEYYKAKDGNDFDFPLVVLINGNSASASEIFAGGIKDYKAGKLIGEKSYGKGIVQQVIPISDTEAVKLTIAEYHLPNGESIHQKGIEPDIEISLSEEAQLKTELSEKEDLQLQKGLEVIKSQIN